MISEDESEVKDNEDEDENENEVRRSRQEEVKVMKLEETPRDSVEFGSGHLLTKLGSVSGGLGVESLKSKLSKGIKIKMSKPTSKVKKTSRKL